MPLKTFRSRRTRNSRNRRTRRNLRNRRSVRRPYRKSMGTMMRYSGRNVVANRFRTKLVYADFFTSATAGGGAILWRQFALNGLFDPDITGSGHQPRGFDQFCPTLYANYAVRGAKVVIEGRFSSGNLDTNPVTGNVILGAVSPLYTALPSDMSTASELQQYITVTRDDQRSFRISKYYTVAHVMGISRSKVLQELNYAGSNTSNPTTTPLICVGFVNMNSATVISIQWSITIVYYVDFYSPVTLAQS